MISRSIAGLMAEGTEGTGFTAGGRRAAVLHQLRVSVHSVTARNMACWGGAGPVSREAALGFLEGA